MQGHIRRAGTKQAWSAIISTAPGTDPETRGHGWRGTGRARTARKAARGVVAGEPATRRIFESRSDLLLFSSTSVRRALGAFVAAALALGAVGPVGAEPLSDEEIWAVVAEAFPEHQVAKAVRVAYCESTFDPEAQAPYGYLGLFQVDPWLHGWRAERLFGPGASLTDPRVNAHVAAELWAESGWHPWPYCGRR